MNNDQLRGYAAAIGAFLIWGFAPLFWVQLKHVPSMELLAYRIVGAAVLGALALTATRGWSALGALRQRRTALAMAASTALIAVNWFTFLWAVSNERVTETSLGYYTNPLVNVVLGRLVLGERLSSSGAMAVGLAALGVACLTWTFGYFPWVSAALALSFGLYGLIRKIAPVASLPGLVIEAGLWTPLCLAYLLTLDPPLGSAVSGGPSQALMLGLGGLITAAPLLLFSVGARKLPYSTVGMLQYLAPSLQLACAVLVFGEPFTVSHGVAFAFIWAALLLYAFDAVRVQSPRS